MADKKQVPLGAPLPLSDADLDALTTAEETEKAQADGDKLWKKANPDSLTTVLNVIEVME
jgi:hypothetical protein